MFDAEPSALKIGFWKLFGISNSAKKLVLECFYRVCQKNYLSVTKGYLQILPNYVNVNGQITMAYAMHSFWPPVPRLGFKSLLAYKGKCTKIL